MPISSREAIKKIIADGWFESGQTGSHKQFKHPVKTEKTTIPHPKKDLTKKTIRSIEKQSGVRLR